MLDSLPIGAMDVVWTGYSGRMPLTRALTMPNIGRVLVNWERRVAHGLASWPRFGQAVASPMCLSDCWLCILGRLAQLASGKCKGDISLCGVSKGLGDLCDGCCTDELQRQDAVLAVVV
ncbi:hypothetical protein [Schlesneria sp. T3-172]|uniref:hypothetical protein n=1 Tax=Schlesneria sphaerica TaxID=3373610 RepID=UPI0037C85BD9